MPRVSVVIPAYNHARFIGETLESVLQQTFKDYEIIVVNDGSPDDTAEVLRPYRDRKQIVYIEQANAGQAAARNRGIREASGEYIALLDDDDCWPPNKLEWQVERLGADPTICLIAGDSRDAWATVLREQFTDPFPARTPTLESLFTGNPIYSPGQTLIRREALAACGGFREDIWGADDWDLYIRMCKTGRLVLHSRPALFYRRHAGNASRNMVRLLRNVFKVFQTHLADLGPKARRQGKTNTRRWFYLFGLRGPVFEMRRGFCRREPAAFFESMGELVRRLLVVRLDLVIAKCLLRDLIRGKVD